MSDFKHVAVAGTFDRLHKGQKKLLDAAFLSGNLVSVGICTQDLYKHKVLADIILPFQYRRGEIEEYLGEKGFLERATLYALSDIYGLAGWDKSLQALVVTDHTQANGIKINQKREKKGLLPLKLVNVDLVRDEKGQVISSDRIRSGKIDREGYNYIWLFEKQEKLSMPDELRSELKEALGVVIAAGDDITMAVSEALRLIEKSNYTMIVSVGDVVTRSLTLIGKKADLSIIDYKTKRENVEMHDEIAEKIDRKVINPAGIITKEVAVSIYQFYDQWIKSPQKQVLLVEGEEDLTALPAILLAPLDSWVLYGHYALGIVAVHVTEDKKREMMQILRKFIPEK